MCRTNFRHHVKLPIAHIPVENNWILLSNVTAPFACVLNSVMKFWHFLSATRFRLIKHTRLNVVAFLNELPKTQHDIASFIVDVNTYTVS